MEIKEGKGSDERISSDQEESLRGSTCAFMIFLCFRPWLLIIAAEHLYGFAHLHTICPYAVLSVDNSFSLVMSCLLLSRVPKFDLKNSRAWRPLLHWVYLCVCPLYQECGCIQVCCPKSLCWWLHSMQFSLSVLCIY